MIRRRPYLPGSTDLTNEWADAIWQFASADNRDVFALNPAQPQYGGFYAWAVAEGYTCTRCPQGLGNRVVLNEQ